MLGSVQSFKNQLLVLFQTQDKSGNLRFKTANTGIGS